MKFVHFFKDCKNLRTYFKKMERIRPFWRIMREGHLVKRLISYSIFSGAFLALQKKGDAEVIYTDIEPDVILDVAGEGYYLDINNDGINDIHFFNSSFDFFVSNTPWWSYWTRRDIIAELDHLDIEMAGFKHFQYYFSFYAYYAFALSNESFINEGLNFFNGEKQILAIETYVHSGTLLLNQEGYWFPEQLDHYLGFRLINGSEENFYGWIRCDVKDEGRTLIIKDYAYESQPEHGIVAGDTISYVNIIESLNNFVPVVYSFNNSVFIQMKELTNKTNVNIYNLQGQLIYTEEIFNAINEIELKNYNGLYVIEILAGKNRYVKKIFLN